MSYGKSCTDSNKETTQPRIPRYFTEEGKYKIAQIIQNHNITPQEGMYGGGFVSIAVGCNTCATAYRYSSSSSGGSPY